MTISFSIWTLICEVFILDDIFPSLQSTRVIVLTTRRQHPSLDLSTLMTEFIC